MVGGPAVNPARAGMIRAAVVGGRLEGGKPRASGDDPELPDRIGQDLP